MEEPEPTEFLAVDVYAPSAIDVYDYLTLSFTEPVASIDTGRFPSETESGLVVAGYPVRLYARLFGLEAL